MQPLHFYVTSQLALCFGVIVFNAATESLLPSLKCVIAKFMVECRCLLTISERDPTYPIAQHMTNTRLAEQRGHAAR